MRSIILIIFLPFLFSCHRAEKKELHGKERLKIVVTTGMIGDAAENITGGKADVVALMGPGVDPHLYKATQGDLSLLTEADLVFYNGLHLEGKMSEIFQKMEKTRPVFPVSEILDKKNLRLLDPESGVYDPHIWFDVSLWKQILPFMTGKISELDTANAAIYYENARRYASRLDSLHEAVSVRIQNIPPDRRVLITAHDAFGYFGQAYHMEVKGLQGISTLSDFGLKDITNLVDFITTRKIKAVFIETSVSDKSIRAVVEGCRDRGFNVNIGGQLYSDAMGKKGTPEGTYMGMVHANVKKIVEALK